MAATLAVIRGDFKRDFEKTNELKLPTIPVAPFASIASRST